MKRYVSASQLNKCVQKTKLLCEFFGPSHPKCKKAILRSEHVYYKFLEQFKILDDEKEDEAEKTGWIVEEVPRPQQ
jgi:hypothetical protein